MNDYKMPFAWVERTFHQICLLENFVKLHRKISRLFLSHILSYTKKNILYRIVNLYFIPSTNIITFMLFSNAKIITYDNKY